MLPPLPHIAYVRHIRSNPHSTICLVADLIQTAALEGGGGGGFFFFFPPPPPPPLCKPGGQLIYSRSSCGSIWRMGRIPMAL